jgi:hypothetical protein
MARRIRDVHARAPDLHRDRAKHILLPHSSTVALKDLNSCSGDRHGATTREDEMSNRQQCCDREHDDKRAVGVDDLRQLMEIVQLGAAR